MVVRPREQFLGPITQLDKYQSGSIDAFGSELRNVTIVMNSRASQPATGAQKGSFWVQDQGPTIPKFTDSDGNTFTLCYCGAENSETIGSGEATLVDGYVFIPATLPVNAVIIWSRKTPLGVLGEICLSSQDETGFALSSTSDFDNSIVTWSWFSAGDVVGSGQATLVNGTATVNIPLPSDAQIIWSRNTPSGVLGEIYIDSQSTSGFIISSTSDFDNSIVNWSWVSNTPAPDPISLLLLAGCKDIPATSIDGYARVAQRTATVSKTMTLTVELMTTTGTTHAVLIDATANQVIADISTTSTTGEILTASGLSIISGHIYTLKVGLTLVSPGSDFATIAYAELK